MEKKHTFTLYRKWNHVSLLLQYFEYTSHKEIRFNSVTELCAEVVDGQTSIGMKHCPRDGDPKPPGVVWEFKNVSGPHSNIHMHTFSLSMSFFVSCKQTPKNPWFHRTRFDMFPSCLFRLLSGRHHLPPSLRHVHHSLPHNGGTHRHPDETVHTRRQKPAVEVWMVDGGNKKVAGNLKWPSLTIVQLLQWMSFSAAPNSLFALRVCTPFEWARRENKKEVESQFKPTIHSIQCFYTHVND